MTGSSDRQPRSSYVVEPIGVVRSPFADPAAAPRQPAAARDVEGTIELEAGRGFEFALEDLEVGDALWIVFWFHRSPGWHAKVRPPRSPKRRGLFATRSPHRPNPIGLSVVELLAIDGLSLRVRGVDMLDGTPVLDIKPYVPYADAVASGGPGWLGAPEDPAPGFEVSFAELASAQLEFLQSLGVELRAGLISALALGPSPHPYRRIRRDGEGFVLAHKEWRARFEVSERRVTVASLFTGYRARELFKDSDPSLQPHRAFVARFGFPGDARAS